LLEYVYGVAIFHLQLEPKKTVFKKETTLSLITSTYLQKSCTATVHTFRPATRI